MKAASLVRDIRTSKLYTQIRIVSTNLVYVIAA
jgi:hypothetical protein